MSLIVDQEYIQRHIATRLNRFTKKDANLWNFRCPYCGDSQKNKRKTRGYIYKREQDYFFRCHNCQKGTTLGKLIEFLDPELYRQYLLDSYVEKNGDLRERVEPQKKNLFVRDDFEEPKGFLEKHGMIKISDLPNDHMAVVYLKRRCIPEKLWKHFYYLDDVGRLEELKDKYRDRIVGKEPRLILPYYDRKGNIFALTARALGDSKIKYLHIRLDEDIPLIYGLDRMDKTKELYVVEGQIDSLFLDNCVALSGGGITKIHDSFDKEKTTFVLDNEPRNKEVMQTYQKIINRGNKIVIWPEGLKEKDINEMIIAGMSPDEIQDMINKNTFQGPAAQLAFSRYNKRELR